MNRDTWEFATHSLRRLLHKLSEEEYFDRAVEYRFGLQFNPRFGYFNIWDAIAKDCLGSIKIDTKNVVVRYYPISDFRYEIQKFKMDDRKSIFIPSDNLQRNNDWISSRLQRRCERRIQEREAFLEVQRRVDNPNILAIRFPQISQNLSPRLGLSGRQQIQTASGSLTAVLVDFSHLPSRSEQREAETIVAFLIGYNVRFTEEPMPMEELRNIHQSVQSHETVQRSLSERINSYTEYAQMAYGAGMTNPDTGTFMGRPLEQIRELLMNTVSEATAVTEEMMMDAVTTLDRDNVPPSVPVRDTSGWNRAQLEELMAQEMPRRRRGMYMNEYPSTATEAFEGVNTVTIPFTGTRGEEDVQEN